MQSFDQHQLLLNKLARGTAGSPLSPQEARQLADVKLLFSPERSTDGTNRVAKRYVQTDGGYGFQYCVADLPLHPRGEPLGSDRLTLRELAHLPQFSHACTGVIIRATPEQGSRFMPLYPGEIWALRAFGAIRPDRAEILKVNPIKGGSYTGVFVESLKQQISVGEPSAELLPIALRESLSDCLRSTLGIATPKVMVLEPAKPGEVPRLVYNYFPEWDMKSDGAVKGEEIYPRLHPSPYVVMIYPRACRDLEKFMVPLR